MARKNRINVEYIEPLFHGLRRAKYSVVSRFSKYGGVKMLQVDIQYYDINYFTMSLDYGLN